MSETDDLPPGTHLMVDETPEQAYERRGNDYLRDQITALRKNKKLKEKLTLLRVVCRNCSSIVLEVVATRPYWVVLKHDADTTFTAPEPEGLSERPDGLSNMEWARLRARRRREAGVDKKSIRKGPAGFRPITQEPSVDDSRGLVSLYAVCDCAEHRWHTSWLYGQLDKAPKNGKTYLVKMTPPRGVQLAANYGELHRTT